MSFIPSARQLAAQAIAHAASEYPDLKPQVLDIQSLPDPKERHLALAIHRTVLQRWKTIAYVLNQFLKQPLEKMEPAMTGVLLCGGAQLLFFDRLPAYAVVSEMVQIAGKIVRPGARGLANAILRKVASAGQVRLEEPWRPRADALPRPEGWLQLKTLRLTDPRSDLLTYLAIATSHPYSLLKQWRSQMSDKQLIALCLHSLQMPPTLVSCKTIQASCMEPHQKPGFAMWRGSTETLEAYLSDHPMDRVQDPASAVPIEATRNLSLETIVDYCAGQGTKSLQFAQVHPHARVYATDPDAKRFEALQKVAQRTENLQAVPRDQLPLAPDLLLLDVPCSNTAVLARRPEARYRFCQKSQNQLVQLQQQIIRHAMTLLKPTRYLLYSTCSLCPSENEKQVQWTLKQFGGTLLKTHLTWPVGQKETYQDGGFYALIHLPPPEITPESHPRKSPPEVTPIHGRRGNQRGRK